MKLKNKIILYIISLILILGISIFEILFASRVLKGKDITYTKTDNLSFITYLKDNTHYESKYLKNEYNLVANLIDYFSVDYNYSYVLNEKVNYTLNYDITAILEVYDSDNAEKPIEKREFVLKEKETIKGNSQAIKIDIFNQKIEYATYSKIIEEWKKEISPNASLKVSINVDWKGKTKNLKKSLNDKCTTEFVIPISKKTIDIKIPSSINEKGTITSNKKLPVWYFLIIIVTLMLLVVNIIFLVNSISNLNKSKSRYEQKVNKILREFDRAITEAKGKFTKVKGENYIEVKSFMELLDVHDNVNEPIIYYKNTDNLSVFVIKNGKDNYYSQIKRSDYDK